MVQKILKIDDSNPGTWGHIYLGVLSKSYPMKTNMTGFRWFSKIFKVLVLSSLSIGRVNPLMPGGWMSLCEVSSRSRIHLNIT